MSVTSCLCGNAQLGWSFPHFLSRCLLRCTAIRSGAAGFPVFSRTIPSSDTHCQHSQTWRDRLFTCPYGHKIELVDFATSNRMKRTAILSQHGLQSPWDYWWFGWRMKHLGMFNLFLNFENAWWESKTIFLKWWHASLYTEDKHIKKKAFFPCYSG